MDDFYLHTEMGKWIVTHKEIPYIAVGSWYGEEANLPWIAHEWLSQVLFYEFFSFDTSFLFRYSSILLF